MIDGSLAPRKVNGRGRIRDRRRGSRPLRGAPDDHRLDLAQKRPHARYFGIQGLDAPFLGLVRGGCRSPRRTGSSPSGSLQPSLAGILQTPAATEVPVYRAASVRAEPVAQRCDPQAEIRSAPRVLSSDQSCRKSRRRRASAAARVRSIAEYSSCAIAPRSAHAARNVGGAADGRARREGTRRSRCCGALTPPTMYSRGGTGVRQRRDMRVRDIVDVRVRPQAIRADHAGQPSGEMIAHQPPDQIAFGRRTRSVDHARDTA